MVISLIHPQKFSIRTWFRNCPQYLCLFRIVFECSSSIHDPRKMLVLPNQLLCWVLSTADQDFVSFQPILRHPHTQIRIILFDGVRISIPNLELSPNRASIGFSQIAYHITVLPKDDHTDFAKEERLGLPYWTMILCRGTRIQMSGQFRFWKFQQFWNIFHFYLSTSRYCVSCLSCATRQSGDDIHDFCCRHLWCWWSLLCKNCVGARIIFYNVTSEYNSAVVFLVLRLQFGILQMTDVHQWGKMNFCALRPCFIDHLFFCFWLSSGSTPKFFSKISHLFPLPPSHAEFSMLQASE